jgi:hypothetical protein
MICILQLAGVLCCQPGPAAAGSCSGLTAEQQQQQQQQVLLASSSYSTMVSSSTVLLLRQPGTGSIVRSA